MQKKEIYSKRVAIDLRKKGFKIIETGVNVNIPSFDTYFFESTPEFEKALDEIIGKK